MKKIIVAIVLVCSFSGFAQTAEEDLGSWYMYFGKNKINDKYSLHTELQMRYFETASRFQQLLTRVGLNYQINDNNMLTGGYGFISTGIYDKSIDHSSIEHRIWQQWVQTQQVGRVKFEHRYRLEQRFLNNNDVTSYKNRARYRLFLGIGLNNKKLVEGTWFLALYDEVFLGIQEAPFDQNRLYAALGYKVKSNLALQAGYLNHHVGTTNYNRLQFAVFYNLDFSKDAE